ncbi:MAG: branched-chain amino acid aminotransferase [Fidelibacterota bacterium]
MINPKTVDWDSLGFDFVETKSMFKAVSNKNGSWENGGLIPSGNILISPAASVLNYGQGVFEGMKAYQTSKNRVVLFRPEMNAKRFSVSLKRLCMPGIDVDYFINAVLETVQDNIDYVPPFGRGSLYIRPIAWGTAPTLGVKPAEKYTFMIYVCPVGSYFKGRVKPLNLKVAYGYHRAAPKGIGNVKAIGNYSASLYPLSQAKNMAFDEVIYLNAGNENMVEEVGSANVFALSGNILKTPKLAGSILPGITRNSVLTIAREKCGLNVQETDLSLDELLSSDEVFCTGTAVVVTPVGKITCKEKVHLIHNNKMGPITEKIRKTILGIQGEELEDSFEWLYEIDR